MRRKNFKAMPVYVAFMCMGFGDVVGPLTSQLQEEFRLTNLAAGLVTFMGFIMFGLLSVPMSIYQDRKGKKHVLMIGLIAAFLGLTLPIIGNYSSFALLLGALLLLGTGATILQVAGNPIMREVSLEGNYSRNLSFGQFWKAIGSLSGALIPILAAQYWGLDWKLLFPIYSAIVLIATIYIWLTKIEEITDKNKKPASLSSILKLLNNKYIALMVFGIFLYVGSEVSLSAKLPNYLSDKFDFDINQLGLFGTIFFFIAMMTGRFIGGVILNIIKPKSFLIGSVILSLLGITGLFMATNQILGFISIFIIGLGFANIFPLIFSITIDEYPKLSNEISGLMVTAIIGGAFVPVLFGWVADTFSLMAGFLVPALCIFFILFVSIILIKKNA